MTATKTLTQRETRKRMHDYINRRTLTDYRGISPGVLGPHLGDGTYLYAMLYCGNVHIVPVIWNNRAHRVEEKNTAPHGYHVPHYAEISVKNGVRVPQGGGSDDYGYTRRECHHFAQAWGWALMSTDWAKLSRDDEDYQERILNYLREAKLKAESAMQCLL